MVESSQPKLEMMTVLVHVRSSMKNHARTKKAIVILSCCTPDRATLSSLCIAMCAIRKSLVIESDVQKRECHGIVHAGRTFNG
jgi:hypothetical protein